MTRFTWGGGGVINKCDLLYKEKFMSRLVTGIERALHFFKKNCVRVFLTTP